MLIESEIVVATHNTFKFKEIKEIMVREGISINLTYLGSNLPNNFELKEEGLTFEENALFKAGKTAKTLGKIAIADDSGLEVDILGREPGIFSSRYAGPDATDRENNQKLLQRLAGVPWEKRGAIFKSVIAIASPSGKQVTTEGEIRGVIGFEPKGDKGFGYDPLFYLPEWGKTFGEMGETLKNSISHRAIALKKLIEILPKFL